jgi:hypothetical protein
MPSTAYTMNPCTAVLHGVLYMDRKFASNGRAMIIHAMLHGTDHFLDF